MRREVAVAEVFAEMESCDREVMSEVGDCVARAPGSRAKRLRMREGIVSARLKMSDGRDVCFGGGLMVMLRFLESEAFGTRRSR